MTPTEFIVRREKLPAQNNCSHREHPSTPECNRAGWEFLKQQHQTSQHNHNCLPALGAKPKSRLLQENSSLDAAEMERCLLPAPRWTSAPWRWAPGHTLAPALPIGHGAPSGVQTNRQRKAYSRVGVGAEPARRQRTCKGGRLTRNWHKTWGAVSFFPQLSHFSWTTLPLDRLLFFSFDKDTGMRNPSQLWKNRWHERDEKGDERVLPRHRGGKGGPCCVPQRLLGSRGLLLCGNSSPRLPAISISRKSQKRLLIFNRWLKTNQTK